VLAPANFRVARYAAETGAGIGVIGVRASRDIEAAERDLLSQGAPMRSADAGPKAPAALSAGFRYQGMPLRSGTLAVDGSGNPPAMRIIAISRMPAHPPTTNATINHQAETIVSPPFPVVS